MYHESQQEQVVVSLYLVLTATERNPVERFDPRDLHEDEKEAVREAARTVHSCWPPHCAFDSLVVDRAEAQMILMLLLASCSIQAEVPGEDYKIPWSW